MRYERPRVRRLHALPPGFETLVQESAAAGFPALVRLRAAWRADTNRFAGPGEGLWAAESGATLVGICGLNVDPYLQNPTVGRVRRLYVTPSVRRHGVGRSLVEAVIAQAGGRFCRLRVRTTDRGAARFYEALGFTAAEGADAATASHVLERP